MDQQEQMEFFYDIFSASLPRLGPGDDASTLKALKELYSTKPRLNNDIASSMIRVLDIGCGNGPQTLQLAKHMECEILAVDNHQPFLDELNRRAEAAGLSKQITSCLKDMGNLSRDDGLFDLIWSEGALNLMGFSEGVLNPNGFRDGLELCHNLLTPNGFVAASELCWFRPDPPSECREFWREAYPFMTTVEANLQVIENCGFEVIGHFTLPESAWWDQYCHPLEDSLRSFRERYAEDQEKLDFIESIQMEIDIYQKHSSYYGSAFFLMRSC
jgi:cyclopropane fatty-acyl-phospholipid synthase-like methyltransferase